MKDWLVRTSCKPRKFSHSASWLVSKLPENKTSRAAGGWNSIESKGDSEADWTRRNQEKERRLKKKTKKRQTALQK